MPIRRGIRVLHAAARLPGLSAGQHTLELASYVVVDGAISESPKSPPFRVNVTGGADGADAERHVETASIRIPAAVD